MNGRFFVALFLLVCATFILFALLFNFYPPAANSFWTLLGLAVWLVGGFWLARRLAKP